MDWPHVLANIGHMPEIMAWGSTPIGVWLRGAIRCKLLIFHEEGFDNQYF